MPPSRGAPRTPLGLPGQPILPASLRAVWERDNVPTHVATRAGATGTIRYGQLTARVHARVRDVSPLVEHVVLLVQARLPSIEAVRVAPDVDPATRVLGLELSPRTRNALLRARGVVDGNIGRVTWGQLLNVRNLGVRSALEFAIALDGARRRTRRSDDEETTLPRGARRTLDRVAQAPWSHRITLNDPRLGGLMRRDRRTVREAITAALAAADQGNGDDAHDLLSVIDGYVEIAERINDQRADQQLRELIALLLEIDGVRLDAMAARMGVAGAALTLQDAGVIAGVTRERIRQLQVKFDERLRRHRHLYLPAVDRAVETLRGEAPIRVEDAERLLAREKLARRLDVATLVADWLPALGRGAIGLDEFAGDWWLYRPEAGSLERQLVESGYLDPRVEAAVLDAAGRLTRSVGICSLSWVAEEAGVVEPEFKRAVRRVVKSAARFSFLDRQWFWDTTVPFGRNRLENTLRKILSVTPRVRLVDVMEALDRIHRQGRLPRLPDVAAVAKFLDAHPSFKTDDDCVASVSPFDPAAELAETERIFVEILSAVPGGVLDREALRRACTERGMNGATFGQYTSFSPILVQPARNLWAMRGREVDSSALERLSGRRRRRRRHAEATRTSDGRLLVGWTITSTEVSVFAIPAAERYGFVGRDYDAIDALTGSDAGTIRVDEGGTSWGYGRYLRAQNVAAGDRIVASFDPRKLTAHLDIERGADRPWVGDLGNCFLHADSWALRLYVDDGLLGGEEFEIPLALADAAAIGEGVAVLARRRDPTRSITIHRTASICTAAELGPLLREIGAARGDRVFVEIHPTWFEVTRVPPPNTRGDALSELLQNAGLPASLRDDDGWRRLSRALGGTSDGTRVDVEERLRERGDHVGLGLLQRWRPSVRAVSTRGTWNPGWELYARLVDDPVYAVRVADEERRVVAVSQAGRLIPHGSIPDSRGRVWAPAALAEDITRQLQAIDGVDVVYADIDWHRWARAEHLARRLSLIDEWSIEVRGSEWLLRDSVFGDLRSALEALVPSDTGDDLTWPATVFASGDPYPATSYAFRRAVSQLVRDGVRVLRGSGGSIHAVLDDGTERSALDILGLLR